MSLWHGMPFEHILCHNPSLGLTTQARGCKAVDHEEDLGVTSLTPGSAKSVREWTLTLPNQLLLWELESQMDFRIFKTRLQGSKPIDLKNFLYHWKANETYMFEMGSQCHLSIWNTSYGQKKGRESNCQFDSWPIKVRNRPDLLAV
jgi:hypothetical protein